MDPLEYSSSWKQPFLCALQESDNGKLAKLVVAAEHAIILRQRELKNFSGHHEERSEMQVALAALLAINVYKLGDASFQNSRSLVSALA